MIRLLALFIVCLSVLAPMTFGENESTNPPACLTLLPLLERAPESTRSRFYEIMPNPEIRWVENQLKPPNDPNANAADPFETQRWLLARTATLIKDHLSFSQASKTAESKADQEAFDEFSEDSVREALVSAKALKDEIPVLHEISKEASRKSDNLEENAKSVFDWSTIQVSKIAEKELKRLTPAARQVLEDRLAFAQENPEHFEPRKSLAPNIRIVEFNVTGHQFRAAYRTVNGNQMSELVTVGSHQNFYLDRGYLRDR